jgi:hypothetical protein
MWRKWLGIMFCLYNRSEVAAKVSSQLHLSELDLQKGELRARLATILGQDSVDPGVRRVASMDHGWVFTVRQDAVSDPFG